MIKGKKSGNNKNAIAIDEIKLKDCFGIKISTTKKKKL